MIPGSLQAVRSKKQTEKTVKIAPVRMTSQPRCILAYVRRHSKAKKSAERNESDDFCWQILFRKAALVELHSSSALIIAQRAHKDAFKKIR